jgi:hypothetical protein
MTVIYKGCVLNTETHKYCNKCETLKHKSEYYRRKKSNRFETYCKECAHKIRINRLRTNQESKRKHKESAKRFRENNPEKTLEIAKRHREKNKEKIAEKRKSEKRRAYNRQYMKKLRSDPLFKMKCNVSRQIVHALKRKQTSKHGEPVLNKLGYSLQQLKEHLEKQFDNNMNWENYGTYWHIDHIIPHSSFSYISMDDEEFKKCWSLENLRPLEAIENIKKSNKIITEHIFPKG